MHRNVHSVRNYVVAYPRLVVPPKEGIKVMLLAELLLHIVHVPYLLSPPYSAWPGIAS